MHCMYGQCNLLVGMKGRTRPVISSALQQIVDAKNYSQLWAKPPIIGCHLHTKVLHRALTHANVNVFGTCCCDSPSTISRLHNNTGGMES
eukprot:scaffold200990_cov27-Prasinocladus_malaysianus.AAC.1